LFKLYKAKNNHTYKVFSNGDIVSTVRTSNGCASGEIAEKQIQKYLVNGYEVVNLGDKERNVSVHRLIAKLFIDKKDETNCVNHINGIKNDNRVENLEWVTRSENMIHSYEVLHQKTAIKTDEECRLKIIKLFNSGESMKQLSHDFNLSYNTIRRIICGSEYKTKTNNANYSENYKKRKTSGERIPLETKGRIKTLKDNGMSYSQIAAELKISKYSVAVELGWKRK